MQPFPRVSFPSSFIPRRLTSMKPDITKEADEIIHADVLGVTTHATPNPLYKESDIIATKEHMVTYFIVGLADGSILKVPSFNCRYEKV